MSWPRPELCWLPCALCCALLGCGSDKPHKPAETRPARATQANEPTELADKPLPAEERAPPAAPAIPPAPDPPGEHAYAHFDAAGQASRAIFEGDLKRASPHLAWLGHHQYPSKLPVAWQPYAARTQLAARVLARASTVGEALRALPMLDAACGACHAALAQKDFNATEAPVGHGDATYALLHGLAGPSDKVFARAARAAPHIKDKDKADDAMLKALEEASAQAEKAGTWVERLAASQALFGQCGGCHVALR